MASGGYRPQGGRPRKSDSELKTPRRKKKVVEDKVVTTPIIEADKKISEAENKDKANELKKLTPLEYAHEIMNDPSVEEIRRDRMAIALLPFFHKKLGEGGKREQKQDEAKKVSSGKFSPSTPPKLVVNNK